MGVLSGHTDSVNSVCALEDGRAVSASSDLTLRVWSVGGGEGGAGAGAATAQAAPGGLLAPAARDKHEDGVLSLCEAIPGELLVSAGFDERLRVWCMATGACLRTMQYASRYYCALLALGSGRVASAGPGNQVRVWDAVAGAQVAELEGGHRAEVTCLCALPGERLVSGSRDRTLRVFELGTGVCVGVLRGHKARVHCVCALPGGARVASGAADACVRVWDVAAGSCVRVLRGGGCVTHVCALPCGALLSCSWEEWEGERGGDLGTEGAVRVWEEGGGGQAAPVPVGSARCRELLLRTPRHFGAGSMALWRGGGREGARLLAPWGAPPVHLGAQITCVLLVEREGGGRVAAAGTMSGEVHLFAYA